MVYSLRAQKLICAHARAKKGVKRDSSESENRVLRLNAVWSDLQLFKLLTDLT